MGLMAGISIVIIYLRVSTEEQKKKGFSLPEQRRACLAKAQELAPGAEIREFADDMSGSILEGREQLDAARALVKTGQVAHWICLHPDRFARDLAGQMVVYDELRKARVSVAFVQVGFEDSPEGRLFLQMTGAISEYERAKIRERSMRGKRGKMRAGGIPTRVEPYGFRWDPDADLPQPVPEELRWVRQMFMWAAGLDGPRLGCQQIADRLDSLGVATKRDGRWYRSTVKNILRNSTYIGQLQLNRHDFTGLQVWRRIPRDRRPRVRGADGQEQPLTMTPRRRPRDDWHTINLKTDTNTDVWLDDGLFALVQSIMDSSRRTGQRGRHLLSGLMVCSLCGTHARMFHGRRWYIRCEGRYPKDAGWKDWDTRDRCTFPHIPAEPIVDGVWAEVRSWLLDPDKLRMKLAAPSQGVDSGQARLRTRADLLGQQITDKQQAQAQILLLMERRKLHPTVAEQQLGRLQTELEHLEEELRATEGRLTPQEPAAVQSFIRTLEGLHAELADVIYQVEKDETRKRQVLLRVVRQVVVYPDSTWETIPRV